MRIVVTPTNMQMALAEAAKILRGGGIVAFPTDTVYGVGALVFRQDAVEKLFQIKTRDRGRAIPVLLGHVRELNRVARNISPAAWQLAGAFWPGALSMVLEKLPLVPDIVTGGDPTIAVRIPDHRLALKLIERAGAPLATTSANLSGQSSPVTADEVEASLGNSIDLLLDGGPCPGGTASTVIDLTVSPPKIIRSGPIRWKDMEPLLNA